MNAPLLAQYYPQTIYPPPGHVTPLPPPYGYPSYHTTPYTPAPTPVPSATPYSPLYHQLVPPYHVPEPKSSPAKLSHNISLDQFCIKYGISNSDKKLRNLEYKPGHHGIERFEEIEWQEYEKFWRWTSIGVRGLGNMAEGKVYDILQ